MRNDKERADFINNPLNWKIVENGRFVRVSKITYKGDDRYKVEVRQWDYHYDFGARVDGHISQWHLKDYYRLNEVYQSMEQQSLTQIRAWVSEMDKRFPDKKQKPETLDIDVKGA